MFRADAGSVKKILACLVVVFGLRSGPVQSQSCPTVNDPASHTKVADQMPDFTVTDTEGKPFSLASQRGKVVVVNFWATWCGPCQIEIPRLEKEIWKKYQSSPNFAMIAIAREQTANDIVPFRQHKGFSFPIAPDPKRSTYGLFADSGIPRTYVVDPNGKILFQTEGYCPGDFDRVRKEIERGLSTVKK